MADAVKKKRKPSQQQVRKWKGGSRFEPPLYPVSEDDEWCNTTRRRLALALGNCIVQNGWLDRVARSFKIGDLEKMAEDLAKEYVDARCERYDAEVKAEAEHKDKLGRLDRLFGI